MKVWYERMVLVAAIVLSIPVVFFALAYGPLAFLGLPLTAIVALILYVRMRRARLTDAPIDVTPRADRRPPIPPVDDATLADVPEPVTACPECAFLGVRMPEIRDGLWPGGGELGSRVVCPRCGYQGLAVRFETREDYGAFLRELAS